MDDYGITAILFSKHYLSLLDFIVSFSFFCIPKRRRGFSYNCVMFFECRGLRVMEESIHETYSPYVF